MSSRWARAGRRPSCMSRWSPSCRGRARAPAGCITWPSAPPTWTELTSWVGDAPPRPACRPAARSSATTSLALFPRAQRHPVRDRDRRAGLHRRRAAGDAGRKAGAAAVPRSAARNRGGPQAAVASGGRWHAPAGVAASHGDAHISRMLPLSVLDLSPVTTATQDRRRSTTRLTWPATSRAWATGVTGSPSTTTSPRSPAVRPR